MPSFVRRSWAFERGTKIWSAPPAWSRGTTALPRKPLPPVTITRRPGQKSDTGPDSFVDPGIGRHAAIVSMRATARARHAAADVFASA